MFILNNRAVFKYDDKRIVYTGDCGENYEDFLNMCEGILPMPADLLCMDLLRTRISPVIKSKLLAIPKVNNIFPCVL